MKAFILRSYGSPDALDLTDTDRPAPATMRCWSAISVVSSQVSHVPHVTSHLGSPVTDRSN